MKSLSFLFFTLIFSTIGFSQGNLQFNQVLNLAFSAGGANFAVPPGKVWKIETVSMSGYSSYFGLSLGGQSIFLKNTHTGYGPVFESFPFWVAGGQTVFMSGLNSGVASVIEFNVVP